VVHEALAVEAMTAEAMTAEAMVVEAVAEASAGQVEKAAEVMVVGALAVAPAGLAKATMVAVVGWMVVGEVAQTAALVEVGTEQVTREAGCAGALVEVAMVGNAAVLVEVGTGAAKTH